MGAPDTSDEANAKLLKQAAMEKLVAFNKVVGEGLNELFETDELRLSAALSFAAGLAKGLGKSKGETMAMVGDLFDASETLDQPAS